MTDSQLGEEIRNTFARALRVRAADVDPYVGTVMSCTRKVREASS